MDWLHPTTLGTIGFVLIILGFWIATILREISNTLSAINMHLYHLKEHVRRRSGDGS